MAFTNAGFTAIASLLMADGSVTAFNNANAYLGVGDDTTAFAATQTDLNPGVSSNKLRAGMAATYPQRSGAQITFQCSFTTAQANWAWQENGIFNAASGGTMLTRKVENLGTKTSASTATFTKTLTISQT
jgi:hypothetical protein